jgi:ketosteroid isomerase-like protein
MEVHPFRAAWETRDIAAWSAALAPDVVLHSPIISTPFRGRDAVRELYEVLFGALGDVDITDEFAAGDTHAFFWHADLGGRDIEGADLLRMNADGKVAEVRVLIRPLVGLASFAGGVGPPLAARRGRMRAFLLRVLTVPLRAMMAIADAIASRLALR